MDNPIDAIINGIATDLKKDGFSDKDIEMAIAAARKYYGVFFGNSQKPKK